MITDGDRVARIRFTADSPGYFVIPVVLDSTHQSVGIAVSVTEAPPPPVSTAAVRESVIGQAKVEEAATRLIGPLLLEAGTEVRAAEAGEAYSVSKRSWFWLDDVLRAMLEHPNRYILVGAETEAPSVADGRTSSVSWWPLIVRPGRAGVDSTFPPLRRNVEEGRLPEPPAASLAKLVRQRRDAVETEPDACAIIATGPEQGEFRQAAEWME